MPRSPPLSTRTHEPEPAGEPHALSLAQTLYVWMAGLFVTAIVMANVLGVKLFRFDTGLLAGEGGTLKVEHTVGMLVFPITFLLTDLLNEYYGARAARRVTYIGFSMAALTFVFIAAARSMPILEGIPGTATAEAFENIFGSASLMYVASLVAFLIGSLLDIVIFGLFRRATGGRMIWLRTTGSTVISQVFDSLLVTMLFFWCFPVLAGREHASLEFTLKTAATGYVLKFVLAVGLTPVIYAGRWVFERVLGIRPARERAGTPRPVRTPPGE